jgi:hypothetical protein
MQRRYQDGSVCGSSAKTARDPLISRDQDGRRWNDVACAYAKQLMTDIDQEMHCNAQTPRSVHTANPGMLTTLVSRRYGQMAVTVAAWCALLAHCEGSNASYETWKQVFANLHAATPVG